MEAIRLQRKRTKGEGMRRKRSGELEYLTFPLLEDCGLVDHLFSTRHGGVSKGVYASMNLSYTRGDEKAAVDENYRRIAAVFGKTAEDFVCSDQTHTTNIRVVTAQDKGKGAVRPKDYREVDGLITNETGVILSTFYADCVPLFFVDTRHGAIGLSHSGWRGTVNRMGMKTIQKMGEVYGTKPEDLLAAIGPSICRSCYEIGEDVAVQVGDAFGSGGFLSQILFEKENGKYELDLWKANERILLEAGIPAEKIQVTDLCTCCNPDYLYSHRVSGEKRGNLGAFLSLK